MKNDEDIKIFYVGKSGGCQIICKVGVSSSTIIAHTIDGDEFTVSKNYFDKHISVFKPVWLEINDKLKEYLTKIGIPVIKNDNKYNIPEVAYEGFRNSSFTGKRTSWHVTPFSNSSDVYFRLSNGTGTEFFVNAERLRMCFRGTWEELVKNFKPISQEEKIKLFKELGIDITK